MAAALIFGALAGFAGIAALVALARAALVVGSGFAALDVIVTAGLALDAA
jgi:hypothetical protein